MANHLSSGRPWQLFVVEDSPGDVVILREALLDAGLRAECEVAATGALALARLRARMADAQRAPPDLILLDLNIPQGGGLALLEMIKQDMTLARIPVLVLSTSCSERDVSEAARLHANACLQKPLEFARFVQLLGRVHEFWALAAIAPPSRSVMRVAGSA